MGRAIPLALVCAGVTACAHTTITTNDRRAKIYADGEYLGRGEAKYEERMGLPHTMTVTVKTPTTRIVKEVSREFTSATFALGMFTYMTGWLWGWQYPESVVILLPPRQDGGWDEAPSAWDAPPQDTWRARRPD